MTTMELPKLLDFDELHRIYTQIVLNERRQCRCKVDSRLWNDCEKEAGRHRHAFDEIVSQFGLVRLGRLVSVTSEFYNLCVFQYLHRHAASQRYRTEGHYKGLADEYKQKARALVAQLNEEAECRARQANHETNALEGRR